jgi:hypothetical protein
MNKYKYILHIIIIIILKIILKKEGNTILHIAAEKGFYAIVSDVLKIYKKNDLDFNVQNKVFFLKK